MSERNDLSDYEKLRLENIQRNQRRLKELGLDRGFTSTATTPQRKKAPSKRSKPILPLMPPRRSGRKRKQVDYSEDGVAAISDSQRSENAVGTNDDDEFFVQHEEDDEDAQSLRSKRARAQAIKGREEKVVAAKRDSNVPDQIGGLTCELAAKSGRSTCRKCKTKIEKGAPRVGMHAWIVGRNAITWQCPECFLGNLVVGYDASGRSRCKATNELFLKGELRVGARSHTAISYFKIHAVQGVLNGVASLVASRGGSEGHLLRVDQISGSEDLMDEDCNKLQLLLSSLTRNGDVKLEGASAVKEEHQGKKVMRGAKKNKVSNPQPIAGTIVGAEGKVKWKFGGHTCYGTLLPKKESKTHCFARTHKGNIKTLTKGKFYWSMIS